MCRSRTCAATTGTPSNKPSPSGLARSRNGESPTPRSIPALRFRTRFAPFSGSASGSLDRIPGAVVPLGGRGDSRAVGLAFLLAPGRPDFLVSGDSLPLAQRKGARSPNPLRTVAAPALAHRGRGGARPARRAAPLRRGRPEPRADGARDRDGQLDERFRRGGGRRRLDAIKAAARASVAAASHDDAVWVLRAGTPWVPAMRGGAAAALEVVAGTQPSHGPADLAGAVRRARAIVGQSGLPAREVHLLTDMQASGLAGPSGSGRRPERHTRRRVRGAGRGRAQPRGGKRRRSTEVCGRSPGGARTWPWP